MKFIAIKTNDGVTKGKIAFYCRMLQVSRQGFYDYLEARDRPWKYQALADAMMEINAEDECNDTYGRIRIIRLLRLSSPIMWIFPVGKQFTELWMGLALVIAPNANRMA